LVRLLSTRCLKNRGRFTVEDRQPRRVFNAERQEELIDSIRRVGLLCPLSVLPQKNGAYLLIAGERRLRAIKRLDWTEVPVHVLDPRLLEREKGGATITELALIENMHREELNPIEQGEAFKELLEQHGWTEKQLAERIKKAQSFVSDKVRATTLDDRVKRMIIEGRLSASQARELVRLKGRPEDQSKAAALIAAENMAVVDAKLLVDRLLGRSRPERVRPQRTGRAFTPKKALTMLILLDEGLHLLSPEQVKARWKHELLSTIDRVVADLEDLRQRLRSDCPED
jgi:ParB family transcriptional regulator, chromosome partitioning protein